MRLLSQIATRLISYFLVIAFGLTVVFFVPRFAPNDPVEAMLAKVSSQGAYMDAAQSDALRASSTRSTCSYATPRLFHMSPFDGAIFVASSNCSTASA